MPSWQQEYEQTRQAAGLIDLSAHGKIELIGPEAGDFLHNLSTNDIKSLPAGHGCQTFLANAKARFFAHAFVFRCASKDSVFTLDLADGAGPRVFPYLDRYHISENFEMNDQSEELAQFHVAGPRAREIVSSLGEFAELEPLREIEVGARTLRRIDRLAMPGFDVLCPSAEADTLRNQLVAAGAGLISPETFEVLRVDAGMPLEGVDMDESHLVMELGPAAAAISYAKGCYLGQETIVRTRDLGHVNWYFRGLKIEGEEPVPAGSKLWNGAKEVGRVTSSARSPRLGLLALGYLRRGSEEPGTAVAVETAAGRLNAAVSALPFSA